MIAGGIVGFAVMLMVNADALMGTAFGILLGSIISGLIIKLPLFGLGQLVDNSDRIVELLEKQQESKDKE